MDKKKKGRKKMKLKELEKGNSGVVECIITKVEEKETKSGGTYVNIAVSDGESQAVAKVWNESAATFQFQEGSVVFATLRAEEYNGNTTYVVKEITESSADPGMFVIAAPVNAEAMYKFLWKVAGKCGVYAKTVQDILKDNKENLIVWGAGHSMHHNIRGGLLYHTYRMVKTVAYIASSYNKEPSMYKTEGKLLNNELLIAGTILHDIGKLWELDTNSLGESEYTPKGVMMGHLYLGAEAVGKYGRANKLDEEDLMLLQHMILSHHGQYEYQTVAIPAIPEAVILHHIDMIDSKLYQMEVKKNDVQPGALSERVFGLGQRVYRPTKDAVVTEEAPAAKQEAPIQS